MREDVWDWKVTINGDDSVRLEKEGEQPKTYHLSDLIVSTLFSFKKKCRKVHTEIYAKRVGFVIWCMTSSENIIGYCKKTSLTSSFIQNLFDVRNCLKIHNRVAIRTDELNGVLKVQDFCNDKNMNMILSPHNQLFNKDIPLIEKFITDHTSNWSTHSTAYVSPPPRSRVSSDTNLANNGDDSPASSLTKPPMVSIDYETTAPHHIAIIPKYPHLVVTTSFNTFRNIHQVRIYDTREDSGKLMCTKGKENGYAGIGPGEFNCPWGVAVTEDSKYVVVSELKGARLQVFSLKISDNATMFELNFERVIGTDQLNSPRGLALRNVGTKQTVLVAEWGVHRVTEWFLDGEPDTAVNTYGTGKCGNDEGQLNAPTDVAVLPTSGDITICEEGNNRISVFNGTSGVFKRSVGSQGEEDGQFNGPCAIAAYTAEQDDKYDQLLVLDKLSNRLQVLNVDGEHIFTRTDLEMGTFGDKGLGCYENKVAITDSKKAHIFTM